MFGLASSRIFYFIVLPLAALLRLYKLGSKQLWLDELLQVRLVSSLNLKQLLLNHIEHTAAAPLDLMAQHSLLAFLGQTEFATRLHAAIFGTLTIVALYHFTQLLFDRVTSLLTALLYAFYPLHHHYSQEGRPYALLVLLTICSYLAFVSLFKNYRTRDYLYYVAATLALLYTHHFGVFVPISQTIFISLVFLFRRHYVSRWEVNGRLLIKYSLTVLLCFCLYVPWAVAAWDDAIPGPADLNLGLSLLLIKELGDRSYPLAVILITLAAFGAWKLRREHNSAHLLLLALWLLLPILLVFMVLWLRNHFFAIRYLLFTTPALFILVAQGVSYLAEALARNKPSLQEKLLVAATLVVIGISLGVIVLHLPDRYDDLKAAGSFLRANVNQGDVVVAPEISDVLTYYFPGLPVHLRDSDVLNRPGSVNGHWIYLLQTNYVSDEEKRLFGKFKAYQDATVIDFRGVQIIRLRL